MLVAYYNQMIMIIIRYEDQNLPKWNNDQLDKALKLNKWYLWPVKEQRSTSEFPVHFKC